MNQSLNLKENRLGQNLDDNAEETASILNFPLPKDLQNAIDKINNLDINKLNQSMNKLDNIDVDNLNTTIAKVNAMLSQQPNNNNQLPSEGFLSSLFSGNMSTLIILAVVGVVIYFMFIKDK